MRWFKTKLPSNREKRIIVKFAWWPIRIEEEYRWLEFVRIAQVWNGWFTEYGPWRFPIWKTIRFLPYDPVKDCEIYIKVKDVPT